MATTALLVPDPRNEGIKHKVKVVTTSLTEGIQADWYSCNDEWIPEGLLGNSVKDETEMKFHMDIRREARKKGTYVIEESTNPELNVYLDEEEKQSLGE
jgi:hypothetical protein